MSKALGIIEVGRVVRVLNHDGTVTEHELKPGASVHFRAANEGGDSWASRAVLHVQRPGAECIYAEDGRLMAIVVPPA